jgi:anaerobic magnesium-protoporphyrin IX monomethyl ester cyclase
MLDVVLIYLPKPYLNQPDAQAPLGLMYIASALEANGKTVDLKSYASYTDEEAIRDLPAAKLYGITVTSLELLQANRFAKLIKAKYPDAKISIGGPGSINMEFVDYAVIDSICFGDGEYTILDMLDDAENNNLARSYQGKTVTDLDTLPLPARHLLKDNQGGNIFAYNKQYLDTDSTVIIATRGCPFSCAFCTAPALTNNRMRFRDPKLVAAEVHHVVEKYGIRQFRFSDDMFTANKQHVLELSKELEKENVIWRISCRVKPLDDDMLQAMWDGGCRELSFGIESFDDAVLTGLQKRATAKDNVDACERAAKYGYKTRVLFMIRTPFQTPKTIELNKHYIQQIPFDIIACTGFIPIPGTDVWNNPDKYNVEILNKDLDAYNFYMFGPDGRRKLEPIIKIKDRPLDEFMAESEEFRDWLEDFGRLNVG